ncbi:MAG: hypothetical protein SAL07_02145 [Oscillatoria sp. PMC 1051.18]|nr:hypothetical protein [Oscillatoria salina]MBZ8180414.1 hypothetical protein [Oscillatoria salina IIICB1]MEC4893309.1 hypothetical protein [Oscillatoria sp. PMC 1050.18]MEC5028687.1 hypothetical protein [Oscillatoria sp. PMC 1051.18]NET89032.1 hypothetical protein [Kamptonema sp. SIO1D9]
MKLFHQNHSQRTFCFCCPFILPEIDRLASTDLPQEGGTGIHFTAQ